VSNRRAIITRQLLIKTYCLIKLPVTELLYVVPPQLYVPLPEIGSTCWFEELVDTVPEILSVPVQPVGLIVAFTVLPLTVPEIVPVP